jgi:hypothetical protein
MIGPRSVDFLDNLWVSNCMYTSMLYCTSVIDPNLALILRTGAEIASPGVNYPLRWQAPRR